MSGRVVGTSGGRLSCIRVMAVAPSRTLEPCVTGVCRLLRLYHQRLCVPACAMRMVQPRARRNAGCRREALPPLVRAIGICLCWNLETSGPCVLWLGTFPPPNPARALSEVSGERAGVALIWSATTASPPATQATRRGLPARTTTASITVFSSVGPGGSGRRNRRAAHADRPGTPSALCRASSTLARIQLNKVR